MPQHRSDGDDPIYRKGIVADCQQELMGQVVETIDDRSCADQQSRAADQPGRQMAIPLRTGSPIVVALVHDDQSPSPPRESAPTDLFVRAYGHQYAQPSSSSLPLPDQSRRHQACCHPAVEGGRRGQGEVGLATAHGIGQEGAMVPSDGGQDSAEARYLLLQQLLRRGIRIFGRSETSSYCCGDSNWGSDSPGLLKGSKQRVGNANQRFSDDDWCCGPA